MVSTLIATRTPQPAHRTAGRVGHRAQEQETRARPMKRTPLIAMLTLAAVVSSSAALSACGGKSGPSSSTSSPAGQTTTTKHGHVSKPTY